MIAVVVSDDGAVHVAQNDDVEILKAFVCGCVKKMGYTASSFQLVKRLASLKEADFSIGLFEIATGETVGVHIKWT